MSAKAARRAPRTRQGGCKNKGNPPLPAMDTQQKVTEFFPIVRRGKTSGLKRMKVETSTSFVEPIKIEVSQPLLKSGPNCSTSFAPYDFSKFETDESCVTINRNSDFNFLSGKTTENVSSKPITTNSNAEIENECSSDCSASTSTLIRQPVKRRLIFDDEEPLSSTLNKNEASESSQNEVTLVGSRVICRSSKKNSKGIKTVAELQERLASRGVGRNLHKQTSDYKSLKVVDEEATLLSPRKVIGFSRKLTSPLKPVKIMPTQKTSTKKPIFLQEEEDREKESFISRRERMLKPEVRKNGTLKLPKKYERLQKLFEFTERVISVFQARDLKTTLDKIIHNVVSRSKCLYTVSNFAQIVFVYPVAYTIRVEECPSNTSSFDGRFVYVVEANLAEDLRDYVESESQIEEERHYVPPPPFLSPHKGRLVPSPKKTPVKVAPLRQQPELDLRPKLEAWRLSVRAAIFKHCLVQFMRTQDEKLVKTLEDLAESGNYSTVGGNEILDDELFKDIPEASLPEMPKGDSGLRKSMRDYIQTVEDTYSTLPENVQVGINLMRSPGLKNSIVDGRRVALSPRKYAEERKEVLPGTSVLERIRAKSLAKKRLEALDDPQKRIKRARLQSLLKYIRGLCRFFTFNKRTSIPLDFVTEKMQDHAISSTKSEVEAEIMVLCEVAKDFFELAEVNKQKFVILKNNSPSEIIDILNDELTKNSLKML